jgi:hypothetical protein
MKKNQKRIIWIIAIINLMILSSARLAISNSATPSTAGATTRIENKKALPLETEFVITGGYRRDDLDWNIAGDINGNNPNILSELTWDDIESYQVKFQGSLVWPRIIALRGSANYGWIFNGDNQDSDYFGDNRTFEFSRSNNSTDDGDVWDASIAVGYPFRFGQTVIGTVIPLVGYSHHEQKLKITDGYQTIPPIGPFPGLDSSYDAQWEGPWIGIDLRFKARKIKTFAHRFETYFTYEYHWADYDAEANWNLRDDLAHPKSFKHDSDGNGYVIGAGFNFVLHQHWALNFNFDYQDWSTDDGTSKVFFADGTSAKTRLNEVNWTSYALSLGISLRF